MRAARHRHGNLQRDLSGDNRRYRACRIVRDHRRAHVAHPQVHPILPARQIGRRAKRDANHLRLARVQVELPRCKADHRGCAQIQRLHFVEESIDAHAKQGRLDAVTEPAVLGVGNADFTGALRIGQQQAARGDQDGLGAARRRR